MKKTAKIEVRIPDDEKNAFSEACKARGETISEAVRKLIRQYNRPRHRTVLMGSLFTAFLSIGVISLITSVNGPSQAQPHSKILGLFTLIDTNQNGWIEASEFQAFYDPRGATKAQSTQLQKEYQSQFEEKDSNSDGRLSSQEFIESSLRQSELEFYGLDLNRDGTLSIDEVMPRQGDKAIHNNRQAILTWGAKINGRAFGRGETVDAAESWDIFQWYWSPDGDLPKEYLARAGELFAEYDLNSNGRVTKQEYLDLEAR
ncbi:MAG: EF-hand domain-containing protein [Pseudomonadota bacterium]